MINFGVRNRIGVAGTSTLAALTLVLLPFASTRPARAAAESNAYHQTNLVSDLPGMALIQDPDLVNPWGISLSGGSPFWVANNGTGTSTLYAGDHVSPPTPLSKNGLVVTIPGGLPTGTVFNTGAATDFIVKSGAASGRASFLFASQVGIVSGWNTNVPAPGSKQAQIGGTGDAVYTGLAIGQVATGIFVALPQAFAQGTSSLLGLNLDVRSPAFQLGKQLSRRDRSELKVLPDPVHGGMCDIEPTQQDEVLNLRIGELNLAEDGVVKRSATGFGDGETDGCRLSGSLPAQGLGVVQLPAGAFVSRRASFGSRFGPPGFEMFFAAEAVVRRAGAEQRLRVADVQCGFARLGGVVGSTHAHGFLLPARVSLADLE
jgi:hypothetical protein